MSGGVLIAATRSAAGKTTLALGVLRALRDRGLSVQPAKCGPDYIDPTFHALAAGRASLNLDPWAMRQTTLQSLVSGAERLVVEGAMGLFDGAADGSGSGADLAVGLDLSVILVLDCARVGASVAATLRGFATHQDDVKIVGVILNRIGSMRHREIVERAISPVCDELGITMLGAVPRSPESGLPSRHLGLVPANEVGDADAYVAQTARTVEHVCDVDRIAELAQRNPAPGEQTVALPPMGQHVAIASDAAFCFAYPHVLAGWRHAGAELTQFSPLNDEAPSRDADAIVLPGGYPELHASTLAAADRFRQGLTAAARRDVTIYGECGGYMVLGRYIRDVEGERHDMLDLLPLESDFSQRRLHLGYRAVRGTATAPDYLRSRSFRGHEFHHTTVLSEGEGDPLFEVRDATGTKLPPAGRSVGSVSGSFVHLIDVA